MKSDFVSNVSHELRTPLTSIRESIGLVLEGITGSVTEKQMKFLLIAKRNTERLTNLINDLLDLAKIEAGKIEIRKRSINLINLAKEAMESFRSQAEEKKISLESSFSPSLPNIYADPDRITQVFNNLMSNALKFTSEGGKIRVGAKLSSEPKFVEVSVRDTGVGIASQDLEKIFARFARLEIPLPERAPGTGLGLAIVKEIIDLHQGKVWTESEPGKGSAFYFTLPVRASVRLNKGGRATSAGESLPANIGRRG
jgi:signal transduction histidine kinase